MKFRFHLSTALVCMLVAAGVVAMNTISRDESFEQKPSQLYLAPVWGWPAKFCVKDEFVANLYEPSFFVAEESKWRPPSPYMWNYWALTLDVVVGLVMVVAAGFSFERWVRRRG